MRGQPAASETERHLLVITRRSPTGPAKVCRHQRKFDQVLRNQKRIEANQVKILANQAKILSR